MNRFEKWIDDENKERMKLDRGAILRLFAYLKPHRLKVFLALILVAIGTVASLYEVRLLGWVIDRAIIPHNLKKAQNYALIYGAVEVVRYFSIVIYAYLFSWIGQAVMQKMRIEVFSHLQGLSFSTLDQNPVGRLVTRVTNDISALSEMFSAGFATILVNIAFIFGNAIALLVLNFKLGLIALTVFPLLFWVSIHLTQKLRFTYRDARSKLSALNALLAETVLGIRVVHLFGKNSERVKQFNQMNQKYAEAQFQSVKVYALLQPAITLASGLSMSLVMYFGARSVLGNMISLGVLAAFFSFSNALFQPVRELADKWNVFLSGMASAERIFLILGWKTEMLPIEFENPPEETQSFRGKIEFKDVWFAYEGENWILKGINLTLEAGTRVGIIGPTGAGKSSFISLLLRLYDPQKGQILFDGIDIRTIPRRELRDRIGFVQQEVFLFSGTVEENIYLHRPIERDSQIESDLGFYKNILQERGSNLSSGQKQTLAFARALVKKPDIWILDEATSNMDSETEAKWMNSLKVYASQNTCIWIAHRLATLKAVNLILVIQAGQILEQGSHSELLAKRGYYERLYQLQALKTELKDQSRSEVFSPEHGK